MRTMYTFYRLGCASETSQFVIKSWENFYSYEFLFIKILGPFLTDVGLG